MSRPKEEQQGGTKTVQCKYFLHGACNKGDNCHFSHDLQQAKPNMVRRARAPQL